MAKIEATYAIGSADLQYKTSETTWSKIYDGTTIEGNFVVWVGIVPGDTKQYQLTNDYALHVGTVNPTMDDGYPKIFRNGVDVTSDYDITQIETTFTIEARDITLQSANLTKEYDGTALVGGGDITDVTAGLTGKGYVSGEEFEYTFTGSQLFVGSSDNSFDVGDSNTALASDYNVTKQYGTLTVTGRTAPLTITVEDQTKTYDGTDSINTAAYSVDGELAYNDTITVTLSNSNINAGTYTDGITGTYKIMHDNGDGTYTDVTDMYLNVTVDNGDLTVEKRDVTITSADATKAYDGTALTDHNTSVTSGSFVAGEGYEANVTGSQTEVGDSPNYFTVSAADGTNMNNYNVTKVEGTLTVTGFGDLTITAADASKMFDGTALTCSDFTYTGLEDGHTITVTTAGTITHFGTTDNTVTSYTILDANGNDVTSAYNSITTVDGTLSITKRDVTLTSESDSKKYDGIPLTKEEVTVTGSGFVEGQGASYYNFAAQTAVGSTANNFSYVLNNGTFADDYAITTAVGTLTVTQNDTLITITADSDSKMYDGDALTDSGYTVTGALATGDYFASVTTSGTITDAGTTANVVTEYTILNQAGDDVTSFYSNIQTVDGTLEVTKRSVTLTSATATKSYDGTPLTNSTVMVTGDGWAAGEGATYDVTGSQTGVGTSKNTFSYTLNDSTKAGNYNIETAEGDLTVTPAEFVITVGLNLYTGLSFLYDNTSTKVLEEGQYVVSGLAEGDQVVNVTITTSSANAGIYDEDAYTVTYDIVNASGVSTKASYIITENKNDVEITKRTITVVADSANKVYDGTALTCHTYTVEEGATEEYQLLDGEAVQGVEMTDDSTITHAGSTANKVDASNVTIKKADGSDSSMNYNIETEDGTLTVTQRGVMLISTSADKYYDGTALQNRQVVVTGFRYDENGNVVVDSEGGFLNGDGCTYDFRNDNVVIDKDGNIIAWTVSEQSDTLYGQTEVGTSKNEFDYNNFTSVYVGSFESDYIIIYGDNQESLGLGKDVQDLYGDLTVWGGPVEINMTDYSWTYDYQAKTNGYFDDGYAVVVTTDEAGTTTETTFDHNSEGEAIDLLGSDTIVVNVTGQGGSIETGKVQHVDDGEGESEIKVNTATYTIYRNGVDVTSEIEKYYKISIAGGTLSIDPRKVELVSASDSKRYDGTELTNHTVIEGSAGRDTGFIFGEGAAYEVSGSRTEIGVSGNTFAISELLTDTRATDYYFVMTQGDLTVYVDKDDYDELIQDPEFVYSEEENGALPVESSLDNELTTEDIDILMAKEGVNNVDFHQDLVDINELTLKDAGVTKTISFFDAYGTDENDKIVFAKDSDVVFGQEDYALNLLDGNNTVQIDKDATAKILSFMTNISAVKAESGSTVTTDDIDFQQGRKATLKAEGVSFQTGDIYGSDKKTTVTIGKDTVFASEDIDFNGESDVLSVEGNAIFRAADVTGADTINLGASSTTAVDSIEDTKKLTISNSKEGQSATLKASEIIGTTANDSFNFGNYCDVEIGDFDFDNGNDALKIGNNAEVDINYLDFGDGNDTLKIGSYSNVKIDSLDFGYGTKDKLTIGKGATLSVESLDVDSLEKLSMSSDSHLVIADTNDLADAKEKWSRYSDQIVSILA